MIVLDASVTVKWFASEPGSAAARSFVHSDEELVAPELTQVEVASALVKKAIRQQLSLEEAHEALILWFEAINDGDIVLLPDADDLAAASELALQLAHPLADCLYLALAERLGVALITADRAFARRVARRSNLVRILEEPGG
jgi:predicted nucleic acid-binding protein